MAANTLCSNSTFSSSTLGAITVHAQRNCPHTLMIPKLSKTVIRYDFFLLQVLEQRQKREIEQLESDQEAEKQHVISIALLECQTKHNQLRENLLAQHEEQLLSVESEEGRAEMIKSQQEELSQMEEKLKRECEEIDSSLKADLEAKHARAKLELREKHYKVLNGCWDQGKSPKIKIYISYNSSSVLG